MFIYTFPPIHYLFTHVTLNGAKCYQGFWSARHLKYAAGRLISRVGGWEGGVGGRAWRGCGVMTRLDRSRVSISIDWNVIFNGFLNYTHLIM